MSKLPELSAHGYQIIKELGHNLEGGRFTYLANCLIDNVYVVIKQFQFSTGAGWDAFKAIEREIQSLQGLDHRGIPKYLDKFETDNGYCLVTEYFPADTLAGARSFTPDQIKQIAVQILEILVYLQERIPPIIHRDLKPENILVDQHINVYLIDFGFARAGSGSVAMSSVNAGTFGFIAPEQIRNLKLTNASDLYGLGLTLICLIGAIRSTDIGNYIDFSNLLDRSKIDPKLKGCSLTFVKWLDRMVAPDPSKRFADAATALEGLQPLYVTRYPSIEISKSSLEFKATSLGDKLTQTITLSNSIPETVLEGRWEVEPHPNDPPHTPDDHAWISFSPNKFNGNQVECRVTVDTSKLSAELSGKRTILLCVNTLDETHTLSLNIVTAPLPKITSIFLGYLVLMIIPSLSFVKQGRGFDSLVLGIFSSVSSLLAGSVFHIFPGSDQEGMINNKRGKTKQK
jgi:serine/threonine protein kinase